MGKLTREWDLRNETETRTFFFFQTSKEMKQTKEIKTNYCKVITIQTRNI